MSTFATHIFVCNGAFRCGCYGSVLAGIVRVTVRLSWTSPLAKCTVCAKGHFASGRIFMCHYVPSVCFQTNCFQVSFLCSPSAAIFTRQNAFEFEKPFLCFCTMMVKMAAQAFLFIIYFIIYIIFYFIIYLLFIHLLKNNYWYLFN